MKQLFLLSLLAITAHAAPVTWEPIKDLKDDPDVATSGVVIKAYTFGSGKTPTVSGIVFRDFGTQTLDRQTLGSRYSGFWNVPASDIAGKDAFGKEPAWPVPVFVSSTSDQPSLPVQPLPNAPLRFEARMFDPVNRQEVRLRLAPLHRVHHQRFSVYWKVIAPERN